MPLGSSSAAPVMRPGPRFFRIEKADAGEAIEGPWEPPFEPVLRIRPPGRTPTARLALLTLDLLSTAEGLGDRRPRPAFDPDVGAANALEVQRPHAVFGCASRPPLTPSISPPTRSPFASSSVSAANQSSSSIPGSKPRASAR